MILEPPLWATDSWVADVWADGTWGIVILPPHGEGGISVELPAGWLNFSGGGSDPDLCGETEESPGTVPPIDITLPGGGSADGVTLSCISENFTVILEAAGGVPPFIWAANGGEIVSTGVRTARITIHEDPNADPFTSPARIAFWQLKCLYTSHVCTGYGPCNPPAFPEGMNKLVEYIVQGLLMAHDCAKSPITIFGDPDNGLVPFYDDEPFENPIGGAHLEDANRTMDLTHGYNSQDVGTTDSTAAMWGNLDWAWIFTRCTTDTSATCGVTFTCTTAGVEAIHGEVWSGAAPFSESFNIPLQYFGHILDPGCASYDNEEFISSGWLDVRTQEMVDTQCCMVPAGTEVMVTVVDAENNLAVIIIPVVEPT